MHEVISQRLSTVYKSIAIQQNLVDNRVQRRQHMMRHSLPALELDRAKSLSPGAYSEEGFAGFRRQKVVQPDMSFVKRAHETDFALVDHIHYDNEKTDWALVSDNFCLIDSSKKRVRFFIETMHDAKI